MTFVRITLDLSARFRCRLSNPVRPIPASVPTATLTIMHRFFCPKLAAKQTASGTAGVADASGTPGATDATGPGVVIVELEKEESHHAAKVLRLKAGDPVELFDGQGLTGQGSIDRVASRVAVAITSIIESPPPVPRITLATAIPKGPRADVMIEQLSQLGCDRIIPLRTVRSVVDPRDTKLDRFARAAIESAKQCCRAHLMTVAPAVDLRELLNGLRSEPHDLHLIAMPGGDRDIASQIAAAKSMLILIGPEGGWTDSEIAAAREAGCKHWSLGPNILRIETAAAAAVAIVRSCSA